MEYPENACIKPPGVFLRPLEAFSVLVCEELNPFKRREWKQKALLTFRFADINTLLTKGNFCQQI
jgi:hypothetical protein